MNPERRRRLTRGLALSSVVLLAVGLYLTGWWVGHHADVWSFEREHRDRFGEMASGRVPETALELPPPGAAIGRIEIPELNVHALILAGTGEAELARGAGHIPGTALPGGSGNVVLAGHRDTHFRALRDVRVGQLVRLASPRGLREYRVVETRVVTPDDLSVLETSSADVLTLITCYPFTFVGAAPERFVVRAVAAGATAAPTARVAALAAGS